MKVQGVATTLLAQALLAVGKNKRALTQLRRIFTQHPNYKDVAQLITEQQAPTAETFRPTFS